MVSSCGRGFDSRQLHPSFPGRLSDHYPLPLGYQPATLFSLFLFCTSWWLSLLGEPDKCRTGSGGVSCVKLDGIDAIRQLREVKIVGRHTLAKVLSEYLCARCGIDTNVERVYNGRVEG